jgi:nitronate monooxygenase
VVTRTPTAPIEDVALPVLVRRVASEVHLPIWAAGGLASPAQVNDVLAVGAEAAAVGTVLLRSTESGASKTYKDALADTTRTETVLTKAFSGRPARALRNGFVDAFDAIAPDGYPAIHYLTAPIRKAAAMASDPDNINLWAGTGHRYATDEPAGTILLRLATLTSPENPAQQHAEPRPK